MQFMIDNGAKTSVEDLLFEMRYAACELIICPVVFSLWYQELKWNKPQLTIHLINDFIYPIHTFGQKNKLARDQAAVRIPLLAHHRDQTVRGIAIQCAIALVSVRSQHIVDVFRDLRAEQFEAIRREPSGGHWGITMKETLWP
jgi:hypothetical protein